MLGRLVAGRKAEKGSTFEIDPGNRNRRSVRTPETIVLTYFHISRLQAQVVAHLVVYPTFSNIPVNL